MISRRGLNYLFCSVKNSGSNPSAISSSHVYLLFFRSHFGTDRLLPAHRPVSIDMPGFHVTVGYLPYRFRPSAISPQYRSMCRERAFSLGQPEPEWIEGSMVLSSTPSQRLEHYEVTIRDTPWTVAQCQWGSEVYFGGPICECARFLPTQLPPPGDLFWEKHTITTFVKLLAAFYEAPCKVHYYFNNYQGGLLETYISRCSVALSFVRRRGTPGGAGFLGRRRRRLHAL